MGVSLKDVDREEICVTKRFSVFLFLRVISASPPGLVLAADIEADILI